MSELVYVDLWIWDEKAIKTTENKPWQGIKRVDITAFNPAYPGLIVVHLSKYMWINKQNFMDDTIFFLVLKHVLLAYKILSFIV